LFSCTPRSLGMEDDDQIDVMLYDLGCWSNKIPLCVSFFIKLKFYKLYQSNGKW
jgi:hypothetical protein